MNFGFYKKYAALSFGLLLIEISIALFFHDNFIRPFIGDMLVVILIFTICRSVLKADHYWLALSVLIFSFAVETTQYFDLISILGVQNIEIARIIIGTTFDFHDLLAYSAGILLIFILELLARYRAGRRLK
jgi:hypothetical protein